MYIWYCSYVERDISTNFSPCARNVPYSGHSSFKPPFTAITIPIPNLNYFLFPKYFFLSPQIPFK